MSKKKYKTYTIPRNQAAIMKFQSVGSNVLDDFILLGKTKSGRYKLGEISGSGPKGYDVFRTRYTTMKKKNGKTRHWLYEGGSPLNSMYYDE